MKRSYIKGLGMFLPEKVVTNDDLAKLFDTSDEWIQQRTGIRERRYAEEGVSCSDLGAKAGLAAISDAGLEPSDIDCVLFASLSPDHHFPGSGCYVQEKIGCRRSAAMDIRNQCTGFLYGMATADAYVKAGLFKNVLVIGAEVHSSALSFTDTGRDVAVLFGDGAGAAVISESPGDSGFDSFDLHADGKYARALYLDIWDISKKPYIADGTMPDETRYPQMDGRTVFKHAVTEMTRSVQTTLAKTGKTLADLKLLVPHQANLRINEFVAKSLELREDQVYNNIQVYGNTTAATLPIVLAEARQKGMVDRGDLVMFVAFGSGFTWGSALMRF